MGMVVGGQKILGTGKRDLLIGTDFDDMILGRNGQDMLFAGLGDDFLDGGNGNDLLNGGGGSNVLTGGRGSDTFQIDAGLQDSFDLITDFEGGSPNERVAAKTKSDTLEILNAEGRAILLVQTDEGVDLYIDAVKYATLAGADAQSVFELVQFDGSPASFEIGDAPGGENRAPEVGKNFHEVTENTGEQTGDLREFVTDPDGDTMTFRLIDGPIIADGASDQLVAEVRAPPGFALAPDGSWTFDTNDASYDELNSAAFADLYISFEADDGNGGVTQGRLLILLKGANDAPVDSFPVFLNQGVESIFSVDLRDYAFDPDNTFDELTFSIDFYGNGWEFDNDHTVYFNGGDSGFGSSAINATSIQFTVFDPEGLSASLNIVATNANFHPDLDY